MTTANQSYAGGTTTGWSNATGNGAAAGNAVSGQNWAVTGNSASSGPNCVTTTTVNGSAWSNLTDSYNDTANWTQNVATDGSVTYDATVENDVAGSENGSGTMTNAWQTTYTYPGGGNMPGMSYSTSGSSTTGTGGVMPQSYAEPVNYPGYYTGRYTSRRAVSADAGRRAGLRWAAGGRVHAERTDPARHRHGDDARGQLRAGYPVDAAGGRGGLGGLGGRAVVSGQSDRQLGAGDRGPERGLQRHARPGSGGRGELRGDLRQHRSAAAGALVRGRRHGRPRSGPELAGIGPRRRFPCLELGLERRPGRREQLFRGVRRHPDLRADGALPGRDRGGEFRGPQLGDVHGGAGGGHGGEHRPGAANPCGAGVLASIGIKAVNGIQAVGNAWSFSDNMQAGNYGSAAMDAVGLLGNVSQMLRACFAAGTPLLTPDGWKPIEDFREGDLLLSASEDDPAGPIEPRRVEEIFTRVSAVVELRVCGQSIRTTAEHPFYVQGKGWTAAAELASGDLFRSHDGRWNPVESINPTGEVTTVYNMRIAEYHTYFVGSAEWGFSVWAHNAACSTASVEPDWSAYPKGLPKPPVGCSR